MQNTDISPREMEVWKLIAEGRANEQIAEIMDITLRTVEHHINMLYAKLFGDAGDRDERMGHRRVMAALRHWQRWGADLPYGR